MTVDSQAPFFAGCCLVANGSCIAIGSFDQAGECGPHAETGFRAVAALAVYRIDDGQTRY